MDKAIKIAKLAVLSSLALSCFALTLTVIHMGPIVEATLTGSRADLRNEVHSVTSNAVATLGAATKTLDQATATLKAAETTANQAKTTIVSLDPSIESLHADLQEGYKVEHDARLSLDNVNKAAIDERMYFERDLPPLMNSIQKDLDDFGETETAANALIADQNLKRILANSSDMTDSGKRILSDAKVQADRLTYPAPEPWYKRVGHFALGTGKLAYDFYFR